MFRVGNRLIQPEFVVDPRPKPIKPYNSRDDPFLKKYFERNLALTKLK